MKRVGQHLSEVLAAVRPLPALDLALLDAMDCVLAQDVVAGYELPTFDNSSMDGYAVHAADVAAAGEGSPVVLPVVGDVPAGSREHLALARGSAIRIMTGAPVPQGCDAVVPVEWTDAGVVRVSIIRPAAVGRNIRRSGEDVRRGDRVLAAGTRLGPRHVAILAATGHDRVRVRPRPRVVVVSTGSELVEPGKPPGYGQVTDVNGYALTAAIAETGAVAYRIGVVADDDRLLLSTLEDQLMRADLIVTTGGVSAGAYDTVKDVLSRLGTVRFDKVAMQPGMPQGFGTIGEDAVPIFTLPGNPVSAYVSFEVFVRPALRAMLGEPQLHRPVVTAAADVAWSSAPGKRQFVRATITGTGDAARVRPVGGHGSHLVADLARADCLAVVPEDVTEVAAGDRLDCWPLTRGRQ